MASIKNLSYFLFLLQIIRNTMYLTECISKSLMAIIHDTDQLE